MSNGRAAYCRSYFSLTLKTFAFALFTCLRDRRMFSGVCGKLLALTWKADRVHAQGSETFCRGEGQVYSTLWPWFGGIENREKQLQQ